MKEIKVPFEGKGYKVSYKAEIIDINLPPIDFLNVYSVFINDEELKQVIGDHFTILQHPLHSPKPSYVIKSSGNVAEVNLKKTIAQQIMNNPTE